MSSAVVALADASETALFGGKAAHLAAALQGGLPVPEGMALSVVGLSRAVEKGVVPRSLLELLPGPLAVRSSALGEDSAEASFAGMLVTRLNVTSEPQLAQALRDVHDSASGPGALAYRSRLELPVSLATGAVVQRLVRADVAGVLFTRDPRGGEASAIEASWGLGEAVVSGVVIPDRFTVGRDGTVYERAAGSKDVRFDLAVDGGVVETDVSAALVERLCLSDGQLVELAAHGRRCEELFGGPQDVEWAIEGGALRHLQSRPITA